MATSINTNSPLPTFYTDFVHIWHEMSQATTDGPINAKYAELSKIMGQYAALNNQFISIFNTKAQRVLYMSDNYLNVMGYGCTEEEYKRWSVVYWMRDLPLAQSWFLCR